MIVSYPLMAEPALLGIVRSVRQFVGFLWVKFATGHRDYGRICPSTRPRSGPLSSRMLMVEEETEMLPFCHAELIFEQEKCPPEARSSAAVSLGLHMQQTWKPPMRRREVR